MDSRTPASGPAIPDRRICVADDDVVSSTMLRMLLERWGYEPVACKDGQEALDRLSEADSPDLALLDWMMPRLDGIRLCRLLRADARRTRYLILLTARSEDAEAVSALRSGADDYIAKPFSPHVLQARIEVGFRTLELHRRLAVYASEMRSLAASRAAQLVHADRMASIGALSASVAHEISNPTNLLSVDIQALRESWPAVGRVLGGDATESDKERAAAIAAEMPAMLGEMEEGISRIRRISSELRSFSRTGPAANSAVDLSRSLEKAVRMCSIHLGGRIETRLELPADLPRVLADEMRLEQVFVNLLINAADAVEGRGERWISVRGHLDPANRVRIRVEDSGPGIPPEIVPSLFQPFFTTKPAGKGTGLGLHISRQIVEEFGGQLALVPPAGTGACFEVAMPALEGAE